MSDWVEGSITPRMISYAYRQGLFPMTTESGEIAWYRPYVRAVFPLDGFRTSRSLAKTLRRGLFEVRFNTSFESVMRGCIRPTDNWISEPIVEAYTAVHREGWGHSVECWADGELVGGAYGVAVGGVFCAESMFHRRRDASKVALRALIARCREIGFGLFDAQVMNPHLESLGARPMTHRSYMAALDSLVNATNVWSEGERVHR